MRAQFQAMDVNGDGQLTYEELRTAMFESKIELPGDFEKILRDIDSDRSGKIDYTEFIAATLERKSYIREDVCWAAFRIFDLDGDGVISKEELRHILIDESDNTKIKKVAGERILSEMMSEVDANGDG